MSQTRDAKEQKREATADVETKAASKAASREEKKDAPAPSPVRVSRSSSTRAMMSSFKPKKIKPQEREKINLGYTNLSQDDFSPHYDTPYLFVYVPEGKEGRSVILGVEEPWKYPRAFGRESWEAAEVSVLKKSGPLGHPTLAATFSDSGTVDSSGAAFIGGELKYDKKNREWVLDNYSGRFGLVTDDPYKVQLLMQEIADEFEKKLPDHERPQIRITLNHHPQFKKFNASWFGCPKQDAISRAIHLLTHYANEGIIFSNPQINLVTRILDNFKSDPPRHIDDILTTFAAQPLTKPLVDVLRYIAGQTGSKAFDLTEDRLAAALLSSSLEKYGADKVEEHKSKAKAKGESKLEFSQSGHAKNRLRLETLRFLSELKRTEPDTEKRAMSIAIHILEMRKRIKQDPHIKRPGNFLKKYEAALRLFSPKTRAEAKAQREAIEKDLEVTVSATPEPSLVSAAPRKSTG